MSLFNLENPPKAKDLREKAEKAGKCWADKRYNIAENGLKRFLGKITDSASSGCTAVTWLLNGSVITGDSDWDNYIKNLNENYDELMRFTTILKHELEQLGYHVWRVAFKSSDNFAGLLVSWEEKKKFPKCKYKRFF